MALSHPVGVFMVYQTAGVVPCDEGFTIPPFSYNFFVNNFFVIFQGVSDSFLVLYLKHCASLHISFLLYIL